MENFVTNKLVQMHVSSICNTVRVDEGFRELFNLLKPTGYLKHQQV